MNALIHPQRTGLLQNDLTLCTPRTTGCRWNSLPPLKAGSIYGFEVFPSLIDEPRATAALDDEAFGLFGGPVHDPVKPGESYLSISPFMMH
jgi:hypothetical protein